MFIYYLSEHCKKIKAGLDFIILVAKLDFFSLPPSLRYKIEVINVSFDPEGISAILFH